MYIYSLHSKRSTHANTTHTHTPWAYGLGLFEKNWSCYCILMQTQTRFYWMRNGFHPYCRLLSSLFWASNLFFIFWWSIHLCGEKMSIYSSNGLRVNFFSGHWLWWLWWWCCGGLKKTSMAGSKHWWSEKKFQLKDTWQTPSIHPSIEWIDYRPTNRIESSLNWCQRWRWKSVKRNFSDMLLATKFVGFTWFEAVSNDMNDQSLLSYSSEMVNWVSVKLYISSAIYNMMIDFQFRFE